MPDRYPFASITRLHLDIVAAGVGGGRGELGIGGKGGNLNENGSVGTGYGAGGGGASTCVNGSAFNGGSGAPGVIVVDEWR